MRRARRSVVSLVVALGGWVWVLAGPGIPLPAMGGEWLGLKIGKSTLEDAKRLLGGAIQEQPDYWVFRGEGIQDRLNPDTVQVNIDPDSKVIRGIFVFPLWGVTNADIRKYFKKKGEVTTYGAFLDGIGGNYGAGTRCGQKLHYMQLENMCEVYEKEGALVIYDSRDLASEQEVVKLVLFCGQ
ncbi:MAG: hypothetical protein HYY20_13090 [Candidatus Tectomicrobia bacterium]|uniref:Uncharacterized protein n=1 Tax=Tectimicrobiota bacterium TaxID=2528274 RepID=A0A932CQW4_UNCTE|nr:hypothetical protein [Candidatus Tectomicrobia bacterium]